MKEFFVPGHVGINFGFVSAIGFNMLNFLFRGTASQVVGIDSEVHSPNSAFCERVFLTRQDVVSFHVDQNANGGVVCRRLMLNYKQVTGILKEQNFCVVSVANMSFVKRRKYFAQTKVMLTTDGSNQHNAMFLHTNSTLISLSHPLFDTERRAWIHEYLLASMDIRVRRWDQIAYIPDPHCDPQTVGTDNVDYLVNETKLRWYLKEMLL